MRLAHLLIRYPALRGYIVACFENNSMEDLVDLLDALELENYPTFN